MNKNGLCLAGHGLLSLLAGNLTGVTPAFGRHFSQREKGADRLVLF